MTKLNIATKCLNKAVDEQWPKAQMVKNLPNQLEPILAKHIGKIRRATKGHTPEQIDNILVNKKDNPEVHDQVQALEDFFIELESTLNNVKFKKAASGVIGTEIKERLIRRLFKDEQDIQFYCGLTNYLEYQDFHSKLLKAIIQGNSQDGMRTMMEDLGAPSRAIPKNTPEALLMKLMQGVQDSAKFEMYARVDSYLRSEWAEHDLKSNDPVSTKLRTAIAEWEACPPTSHQYGDHLRKALHVLYERFDQVFEVVKVQKGDPKHADETKHETHLSFLGKLKDNKNPNNELPFECMAIAARSTFDVAIRHRQDPNHILVSLASSNSSEIGLFNEGEQLQNFDRLIKKHHEQHPEVKFDVTFMMRSPFNLKQKKVQELYQHIGVLPKEENVHDAFHKLGVMAILSARAQSQERANIRFLIAGASTANQWEPKAYTVEDWGKNVMQTLKTIMPKFVDSKTQLKEGTRGTDLFHQSLGYLSAVVQGNSSNPELIKEQATFQQWRGLLNQKYQIARLNENVSIRHLAHLVANCGEVQPLPSMTSEQTGYGV